MSTQKKFRKYILLLFCFVVLLLISDHLFLTYQLKEVDLNAWLGSYAYFFVATTIIFKFLFDVLDKTALELVNFGIGTTGIKLIVSLVIMGSYSYFNRVNAISFIMLFGILHVIFSVFILVVFKKLLKDKFPENLK